jgi:uncharacterized protein (DUF1501 family)
MTEFGRRVEANANQGTDHGHGGLMMVLSNRVHGGRIYGAWPGLNPATLDMGDLAVTTDYRQVLAEVLTGVGGGSNLQPIFPDADLSRSLGIMRG